MLPIAVIDFETTGMYAGSDRIIEVGAAVMRNGEVVATFSELMDPGIYIPTFITGLTGITNAMVRGKPPPKAVMPRLRTFLGDHACVAHNASFDQRFFIAEMEQADQGHERPFLCSMLLARRLLPKADNYKLSTLARHLGVEMPAGMQAHRALADALVTCGLWRHLCRVLEDHLGREADLATIRAMLRTPKAKVAALLASRKSPALGAAS